MSDRMRCPRAGCGHYQWNHKIQLHGPMNHSEHSGRCAMQDCECTAWDTSVESAQRRFIYEWQQRNVLSIYGPTWKCPLCHRVLQAVNNDFRLDDDILRHTTMLHGDDWLAYEQAGRASTEQPS